VTIPIPSQGCVPTLQDLSLLPVSNWYHLGLQLGVRRDDLDVIERDYPQDNEMCKLKMFGVWLDWDSSATYGKLARAFTAVGKRKIAEELCAKRGRQYIKVSYYSNSIAMMWGHAVRAGKW